LTLCLSRGEEFLNYAILKPRRVLLLDLENRPCGVKARLALMAKPASGDSEVFVYAPEALSESEASVSVEGMAYLRAMISETQPDVLIIDTWRLFIRGDENSQETIVTALKTLSSIRKSRGKLGIILVHHLRKERLESPIKLIEDPHSWVEGVSGHHALVGHVDACYGLERRPNDGEEQIVFGGIARNYAPCTLLLEDDEETLRFEVASGEEAAAQVMTAKEREFWLIARQKQRFTYTELVRAAKTTNKKALSSMLRKAFSHELMMKTGKNYQVLAVTGTGGTGHENE